MRLSRVLLAGAAVATAGIATSAFTNSNTFTPGGGAVDNEVGYGELEVSGVQVSNVAYTPVANDATALDLVTFTVAADAADTNSLLTLTGASGLLGASPFTCTPSGSAAPYLITCDVSSVLIKDVTKVALTVVSK